MQYIIEQFKALTAIPSPSGFTRAVTEYTAAEFEKLGFAPKLTNKGCVLVDLGGEGNPLVLSAHIDTLGGMVAEVKANGRLRITRIGGLVAANVETENCTVFPRFSEKRYSGTCQLVNASAHVNTDLAETKRSFDTVEIDGCAVSRASLHNLSFIENLELAPGCRIKVSKRNQIIPHVEENLDRNCYARDKVVPARCPCCGQPTRIHMTKNTVNGVEKVTAALFCDNEHCETRKLRKFVHFASPKALNIMGLSESILEKFIGKGWLHSYMDIFALDKHRAEIVQMEGFGEKSWQNLWDAIQHSRITTFEQYLTAMDIPMVGSTASKAICQRFRGNLAEFETAVCQSFDFTQLPDFGETLHRNIHQWFHSEENWTIWTELRRLVCIKTYQPPAASTDMSNPFVGKTLVVTGKVEPYTRDGINAKIESLGAHAGSSVSSKTDYLICGENAGSKLAKAQELGIKILSPDEFFRMAGESA